MLRMNAAVLASVGGGLVVETVQLDDPAPHEVLVRLEAAGVCHSDYHYLTGALQSKVPVVPGHEGAGIIEAVGSDVTAVKPGDAVCLMWRPRCGKCVYCLTGRPVLCQAGAVQAASGGLLDATSRLRRDNGNPLHHLMGVSCFAEYCVVSERSVVPVPKEVPAEVAAIAGCAVITGVGVVLNVIGRCAGQGVAIFGAGGVGLSAVLGARLAGAEPIVVIDVVAERLQAAKDLGATHTVDASSADVLEVLLNIQPAGLEWTIDAVGRPETLIQAMDSLRPSGTLVAVGLGAVGQTFPVVLNPLVQREKRIVGSLYGSSNPPVDIPRLLELYVAGRLPLERLVGHRYRLDEVNQAFADLAGKSVGRGVVHPWRGA